MRLVVLAGDDPYIVPEQTKRFIDTLRETHGDVEVFAFDGTTVDLATVLDELRSYGLMQTFKVVVLDAADEFLARASDEAGRTSNRAGIEHYAAKPVDHAVLLMRAKSWRKSRLDAMIEAHGAIIRIKPPNAASAVTWCVARAKKRYEVEVDRDAAVLLVERIGVALARLDTELGKLASFAGETGRVQREHVDAMVELSREEQAWVIQEAILTGDAGHAIRKLRELLAITRHAEVPVTWAICDLMRKLHTAAQLRQQGMPSATIAKQLRLWGPARDAVLNIAQRTPAALLGDCFHDAIEVDRQGKTGVGVPARSLETLLVRIADTLSGRQRSTA